MKYTHLIDANGFLYIGETKSVKVFCSPDKIKVSGIPATSEQKEMLIENWIEMFKPHSPSPTSQPI